MFIITYRKIFYAISAVLAGASILAILLYGFNLGIDFKGGSILEIEYAGERPAVAAVQQRLTPLEVGASVRETGEKGFIIRMKNLTEEERIQVLNTLSPDPSVQIEQKRFDSIGPLLGKEAIRKAWVSIVLVLLAIVCFIAFTFRRVSEPVSSWKYGGIAIFALAHDVLIPTGAFAVLGHFKGYEIDTLFVTALLVILGFSVHDTIVVFDRIRENLSMDKKKSAFEQIIGDSVSQTITRSINTSLTVIISLVVLYFVGGEAMQSFTLALLIGVVAGTYSSIFLCAPMLLTMEKWQRRNSHN